VSDWSSDVCSSDLARARARSRSWRATACRVLPRKTRWPRPCAWCPPSTTCSRIDYRPARMARINEHYRKLQAGYLFPEIGRRVRAFSEAHPDARVIRLGIGDVTLPLAPAIVEALRAASVEMG